VGHLPDTLDTVNIRREVKKEGNVHVHIKTKSSSLLLFYALCCVNRVVLFYFYIAN